MNFKNVTVIIRSAQERTVNLCRYLLTSLFSDNQIFTVEEVPFSAAIKKGLEIGLEENRKWTMTIDADVLAIISGVRDLFERAENAPGNFFAIQGLILDKFFPVMRPSGIHFYRTSLSHKAIHLIPAEGTSLRPESDLLDNMIKAGYPWLQCDTVVGVHDFEQYYKDIFRKCFIQAHKHHWLINRAETYWKEKQTEDIDFKVALWGSLLGKLHTDTVYIDRNFLQKECREIFDLKGMEEKTELSETTGNIAKNVLNSYDEKQFEAFQSAMFQKERWNQAHDSDFTNNQKLIQKPASFLQRVCNLAGNYLIMAGTKLKSGLKSGLKSE